MREAIPAERFGAALLAEMRDEAAITGRRPLGSIFLGGGTPSLMPPELVAALIERATALWPPIADIEITLEANPTSVEAGRLRGFAQAGVNRCSLGVQSLRDNDLAWLGRQHSARDAIAALELARTVFPRVSFDLIYARPGQALGAWRAELRQALGLVSDHLSLYQLTIEAGTRFEALARRGEIVLPDGDAALALYEATGEEAARFGLAPYEVSNYARPGGQSRHNLAYWRYDDYSGIGPGAHGRVSAGGALLATRRHRSPEAWAEAVRRTGSGIAERIEVTPAERAREMLLMGLRLTEGVDASRFLARTGIALAAALEPDIHAAALDAGYLLHADGRLAATARGRMLLDALLPRLVA